MFRYPIVQRFLLSAVILLSGGSALADELEVIGRDGDFVAYANGVVADKRTGLEWIAGPDADTSYYRAVEWVRGLTVAGGGWRMPSARVKAMQDMGAGEHIRKPYTMEKIGMAVHRELDRK